MHSGRFLIIGLFFLITILVYCCTSTSKEKKILQQENDSILSKTEIPDSNKPESVAPGSANITAWMQDFTEAEDRFTCTLKIDEVNGYGPASPPLPKGYVFKAEVPRELIDKNNYPGDKIFVKGKLLQMNVKPQRKMYGSDSTLPWIVTDFYNLR